MDIYPTPADGREAHIRAVEEALITAVTNMEYESMLQVIKHILALRTHVDERALSAEMPLTLVFKMAFAREQGINVEEVYDPIAFGDLTDTQLAVNNFISDMQKSFRVEFDTEEQEAIVLIKDLVAGISSKRLGL